MGLVHANTQRRRTLLLLISGALALLIGLLLTGTSAPHSAAAQVSPLSPLPVATPQPNLQPALAATDVPSPLAPADANQSTTTDFRAAADSSPAQTDQRLIPLGAPAQAQPSMILVGALLVGLVVFVVVLVLRRRE